MKRKSISYHITGVDYKGKFQPAEHIRQASASKNPKLSHAEHLLWIFMVAAATYFCHGILTAKPYQFFPTQQRSPASTGY